MKTAAAVLALFLLCGCGAYPSLEQLEIEASRTGDWSAVERRERVMASRLHRSGNACPPDRVSYCEDLRCACVRGQDLRDILSSWD